MALTAEAGGFSLTLGGRLVARHRPGQAFAFAGHGRAAIGMYRGNFDIADTLEERAPLAECSSVGTTLLFRRFAGDAVQLALEVTGNEEGVVLALRHAHPALNRFWFRIPAGPDEHVWGCGEQMSYFDLRFRRVPLWTSEPGVGRDKSTEVTRRADAEGGAGGDWWTTGYPQPTFLTSRRIAVHLHSTAYAAFDFRAREYHELECWAAPEQLEFIAAADFTTLVGRVSARFGRQKVLPDWLYNGVVVGLKDGAASFARLQTCLDAGVRVSALWCEDWAGVRPTAFGTRLFWDWRWNAQRHPDLPARIADLRGRGIRFLGYVNPYLCADGALFGEAEALGHLVRDAAGRTCRLDFGGFECGMVDFTAPKACDWFADRILGGNMLDLGMSGWMADFGEYLPTDVQLASGEDPRLMHNAWPALWAGVNADALARSGGDALFFMRSGFTGVQAHCPMLWAGDQSVDFSRHDGLQTVICAALSAGLLGNAYHHSDIGGYTSLYGTVRSVELLQRWTEMAAFTPMMRTHEGNRPADNLQFDRCPEALAHLARFSRIWCHLVPYLRALSAEAAATGLPVQRPLFLHHPDDAATYTVQDQYLYGPDLLVAPVHRDGATAWTPYLPAGADWVHVWTGARHVGGRHVTLPAPIGWPPVFARAGSTFSPLFAGLAGL